MECNRTAEVTEEIKNTIPSNKDFRNLVGEVSENFRELLPRNTTIDSTTQHEAEKLQMEHGHKSLL